MAIPQLMSSKIGIGLHAFAAALWFIAYLVFPYNLRIGFLWSTLLAALTLSVWLIRSLRRRPLQRGPFGRRRFATVLVLIGGLTISTACVAISGRSDPQDACRIGQVSPEQYQTLAAEIAALPPIDWDAALAVERHRSDGLAAALRERLKPVLGGRVSTDQQIAAMHAVMRSIGAEFTSATRGSVGVIYHYRLDVNRIGMIRLLSRWATMSVMFGLPAVPGGVRPVKHVSANMPEMLDPGRPGYVKVPQERPCPPMPLDAPTGQERSERLEQQG